MPGWKWGSNISFKMLYSSFENPGLRLKPLFYAITIYIADYYRFRNQVSYLVLMKVMTGI